MNKNKNCAQEIRQVEVPQLALPPNGTSPTSPRLRLQSSNCRYTVQNVVSKFRLSVRGQNHEFHHFLTSLVYKKLTYLTEVDLLTVFANQDGTLPFPNFLIKYF